MKRRAAVASLRCVVSSRAPGASLRSRAMIEKSWSSPSRPCEQIDLGQHDAIGDGHLLDRFLMGIERRLAIDGIDDGDDAFEPAARP